MARNKEFDEETALRAAMQVFWAKGYSATSIHDLEEATGLLRTSIYNTFGNKRELFKSCLALYGRRIERALAEIVAGASTSREVVRHWHARVIGMLTDPQTPAGCLVVFSVLEGEQHDAETKAMAAALMSEVHRQFEGILQKGVRRGELSAELDCAGVAGALSSTTWGLAVLAAAGSPPEQLRSIAQETLRLLG
jgi:TetR/AcrR family transcriptional repressor of nem operon